MLGLQIGLQHYNLVLHINLRPIRTLPAMLYLCMPGSRLYNGQVDFRCHQNFRLKPSFSTNNSNISFSSIFAELNVPSFS